MTTTSNATLGFIGLGNMGAPMCRRLVAAGHDVIAFDLRDEAVQAAVEAGARRGADPRLVAGEADILLTSLPHPHHVESVMREAGSLAALHSGSVWVDLTTNRPQVVARLAAEAPEGVEVVDCPVTGAVDGARTGRLTLFAGGPASARQRVVPILEHLGRVIECGELGTGNVTKLVTNQLWFVHAAAIGEAFALGMANGVDLSVLYDAICDSVGDSFVARHDAPSIFAGHYDPSFTVDLCLKDLGLIGELGSAVGADLPLTDAAHAAFADAERRYGPDVGELHVAKRLEDDADLSFRMPGDWTPPWDVPESPAD
ncbi:MAG: NAD(P)-dependent oxidoreductase [Ilumatobacter sp.]|nr:NAD(P)-dependent oxidoreductase [Ilumatobacter sp.]